MTRREIPLDAAHILQVLAGDDVGFTIIGGLAVQAHGHTRTTQDIDLVPDPEPGNLVRLAHALAKLGARHAGGEQRCDDEDLRQLFDSASVVSLDTHAGGVDVHMRPPGAAPYAQLRSRALVVEVAGVRVWIVGRDDLIAMKRAAGRSVDRGDVIALTAAERDHPKP